MKDSLKLILLLCFLTLGLSITIYMVRKAPEFRNESEEVLQANDLQEDVVIRATIKLQEIRFKVYPEKRHPDTNNWASHVDFRVEDRTTGNIVFERELTPTNNFGTGVINLDHDENIEAGHYTVFIKGISHLTKRYDNIYFSKIAEYYDFTDRPDILAGDTHDSRDDFVNSLDISTLIGKLNTDDYINDLNQDNQVNSLDLSNQVFNISVAGDE